MDGGTGITWLQAVGPAAVALVVMAGPGWWLARMLGFSRLDRLALAAPLGVPIVVCAAVAADMAGITWSRGGSAAVVLIAMTVLSLVARSINRRAGAVSPKQDSTSCYGVMAGLGIVMAGTVWKVVKGVPAPESLSSEPDVQFHLLAITHLLDEGTGSPLRSGEVHYYGDPSFYPGGFHSVAATVATWSGAEAVVAAHVVLVVCGAVVWPTGVIVFVARTVSGSPWVLAAAGSLALTAVLGPIAMLSIGAPWANLMSAALVPGTLLPLGMLARHSDVPGLRTAVAAAVPVVMGTTGAALAHPNGAYSVALLGAAMLGPVVPRWGRGWVMTYVAGLAGVVVCWIVPVNPAMLGTSVSVDDSDRRAVLVLLKNGDVPLWSGGVVAVLTLVGVVIGLRTGRLAAGLSLMWVVTAFLALVLQLGNVLPVAALTWPWFSGYFRIATMVSFTVVVVASLTVAWMVARLAGRSGRLAVWVGCAATVGLAGMALPAAAAGERLVRFSYAPDSPHAYLTPAEASDLRTLARELKPVDRVAVDPARGGVFLGLYGPGVVPVGPFYEWTREIELVATRLDEASTVPEVCAAARELGVTHALVGGGRAETNTEIPPYPGIDRVPTGAGFRLMARRGPFRLFELPRSCAPGNGSP